MYQRFEQLLKEHNVTPYKVAKETNVARSTLTNWKQGNYTPKMEKIQKLAAYFHVSAEWLLGYDVPKNQYDINVDFTNKEGICNVTLSAQNMQNLPAFLQFAINLLENNNSVLVDDKVITAKKKEQIKSTLESAKNTIQNIFKNE